MGVKARRSRGDSTASKCLAPSPIYPSYYRRERERERDGGRERVVESFAAISSDSSARSALGFDSTTLTRRRRTWHASPRARVLAAPASAPSSIWRHPFRIHVLFSRSFPLCPSPLRSIHGSLRILSALLCLLSHIASRCIVFPFSHARSRTRNFTTSNILLRYGVENLFVAPLSSCVTVRSL